jgi:hypothetical protein
MILECRQGAYRVELEIYKPYMPMLPLCSCTIARCTVYETYPQHPAGRIVYEGPLPTKFGQNAAELYEKHLAEAKQAML